MSGRLWRMAASVAIVKFHNNLKSWVSKTAVGTCFHQGVWTWTPACFNNVQWIRGAMASCLPLYLPLTKKNSCLLNGQQFHRPQHKADTWESKASCRYEPLSLIIITIIRTCPTCRPDVRNTSHLNYVVKYAISMYYTWTCMQVWTKMQGTY